MHLLPAILAAVLASVGPGLAPGGSSARSLLADLETEQQSLFDQVAPSVVLIKTPEGFGSGFFVNANGYVLTNRHVVGTRSAVRIQTSDGRSHRGEVIALGTGGVDVALVKTDISGAPALTFASSRDVRVGAWVGSVGHGSGGLWTLGVGMLSNAHGGRNQGLLQTQIPLNPGASGGPVFDRHGHVIGVVESGIREANAINFAITAESCALALPKLRALVNVLVVRAPNTKPIFVDGRLVGAGPLAVVIATPGTYRVRTSGDGQSRERTVEFPTQREVVMP